MARKSEPPASSASPRARDAGRAAAKRAVSENQSAPISRSNEPAGYKDNATLAKEGWQEFFDKDGVRLIGRDQNHPSFTKLPHDKVNAFVTLKIIEAVAEEKTRESLPTPKPKDRYLLKALLDSYNLTETELDSLVAVFQREIMRVLNRKAKIELPTKAPKLYVDRPQGQNIIDFLRDPKGWGPYVAAGVLTRPDLRRLDRKAYDGLTSWLQHHSLPLDMSLPSKSAVIDNAARQITAVAGVTDVTVRRVAQTLASRQRRKPAI